MAGKQKIKAPKMPKIQKPNLPIGKKGNRTKRTGTINYSRLHSIKLKIIALVLISIVLSVTITSKVIINYSKTLVVDSGYGKMLNVASSYGTLVDKSEGGSAITKEEYAELLQDVSLDGLKTAKCFLVDKNGLVAFDPDASKVGMPNKNKVITEVIGNLNKGIVPENLCVEYKDENIQKYASFYITSAKSILVMEVNADELMDPINVIVTKTVSVAIIIIVAAIILAFVIVNSITKPLNQVTSIINDTANLRLTTPGSLEKLCKRRDETGEISRAVKIMTDNLKEVVSKIDTANASIEHDMQRLEESSNQVNVFCTDNSSTAEALASSTEKMAGKLIAISDNMDKMRYKSQNIGEVTSKSNEMSEEVAYRAKNMQSTTLEAIQKTRLIYQQLKEKADAAVEGLKSVAKINELTSAISDISDQTSLLSLNAGIEAARAGEAGKGFAVVATEISKLSNKSLENVEDINQIVKEVNSVVTNISNAMEEISSFLENNVLADYDGFNEIGNQYLADADVFKNTMIQISTEIDELNLSISEIVNNLDDVQNTMTATSLGVTNIAEKTSNVVHATTDNYELTNNTVSSVDDLKQIVDRFEL